MVFQNYALYPHMTVLDNLAFGLRVRRAKRVIKGRVCRRAALLGLTGSSNEAGAALWGSAPAGRDGSRDRPRAEGLLMDEPLSNLDAKLRVGMRASLAELHARLAVTSIYVTHDQTEAMTLGQRVAVDVLRDGPGIRSTRRSVSTRIRPSSSWRRSSARPR